MKRVLIILLVLIVALIAVLACCKSRLVKYAIIKRAKDTVGMDLTIDSLEIGLLDTTVALQGLKINNPPGFKEGVMFSIPDFTVDCDFKSFLKGEVHFREIVIYVGEINIVLNREGRLNIGGFRKTGEGKKSGPVEEKGKESERKFRIDVLKLRMKKATFADIFSHQKVIYDLGIDQIFRDIDDEWDIDKVVLVVINAIENNLRRTVGTESTLWGRRDFPQSMDGLGGELEPIASDLSGLLKTIF